MLLCIMECVPGCIVSPKGRTPPRFSDQFIRISISDTRSGQIVYFLVHGCVKRLYHSKSRNECSNPSRLRRECLARCRDPPRLVTAPWFSSQRRTSDSIQSKRNRIGFKELLIKRIRIRRNPVNMISALYSDVSQKQLRQSGHLDPPIL